MEEVNMKGLTVAGTSDRTTEDTAKSLSHETCKTGDSEDTRRGQDILDTQYGKITVFHINIYIKIESMASRRQLMSR